MAEQLSLLQVAVRRWQRFRMDVPVCVIAERDEKTVFIFIQGRFRNLSEDGLAVYAGAELKIDSEVRLEFTPAFQGGPLVVHAIVRNRRGYVYGLEFLPQSGAEEAALATLKSLLMPMAVRAEGSPEDRESR